MVDIALTDSILSFAIPAKHCRGRVVRLGPALDEILAAHAYPPLIRDILAEAVCLTAMLGALLKDEGSQLTLQAQTEAGVISLLACDYKDGALRGYVEFDRERFASQPVAPSLMALFGKGYLAITFDLPEPRGRNQGIVPLEGGSLSEAVQNYFFQSEQIPTLIRVAVDETAEGISAGGLLVQHLPEGEEGRERLHVQLDHPEWEHVEIMGSTVTPAELTGTALPLEDILWRLFSESDEVMVLNGKPCVKGCRCNEDHIRDVIARFPKEDKDDMVDQDGNIAIDCAFCSKTFTISGASLNN
ncbi:Hsp33 family molecular chaperone HslO [Parasphingorhabdus sp.]|uniref:Hsp33 family molecular chaperone HslO n=1 Tax=Parasphingorhabdus sp. TaxID=2709688 RepID=UPI002B26A2E0|nr:Hsp33 family molecular chaperone HslO [Parasphingorhabdus sp.]|tara:strand:+ start:608 stop:1510 length:903 start_codon:yes stop_codon:yes gene_type:complete